ncbi:MAG: LptF/LptG family permease [Deltaproteobacteria bacterium]|jgi:lipopolysaccharide export system permease protein|nr:LptF/LptG family permease [Deltaproteobacteria bacterium]
MSIISRYLAGLFFKHLALCLTGFLTLYIVVDFVEKISEFISQEIPLSAIMLYFVAQIPNVLILLAPVATLASVLITLVLLARNSEIVAFKGSGVSLFRLSRPLIFSALLLSVIIFLIGNLITPITSKIVNEIWEGRVRNTRTLDSAQLVKDVWIKDVRLFEHFDTYDEAKSLAFGVTILLLDEELNLWRRLEGERGFFSPYGLRLFGVKEKVYLPQTDQRPKSFQLNVSDEVFMAGHPIPPPGLGRHADQRTEEMNFYALAAAISNLEAEGFNPLRQLVDLNFKFSNPFISLIMVFVGIPIGFWREKGGSIALGLVLGLTLSFFYLVTQEISRTMGYAGFLPPFMAAWLPNCFFCLIGLYFFSYVRQ